MPARMPAHRSARVPARVCTRVCAQVLTAKLGKLDALYQRQKKAIDEEVAQGLSRAGDIERETEDLKTSTSARMHAAAQQLEALKAE